METVTLLIFTISSLYTLKLDDKMQIIVAYTSTSITLHMLVTGVIYHIVLLIKRLKKNARVEVRQEYAMVPQTKPAVVTHSVVR